jgi:hypothetical protein
MTDTLIFVYGLELNFTLLHCIVGGPKPSAVAVARVLGLGQCWDAAGHLPNVRPTAGAVLSGVLLQLTPEQRQRLNSARLVPLLYQWRRAAAVLANGRRRQVQLLWAPKGHPPGRPNAAVWQEVVLGALQQGLPDQAIEQLLALRPNDRAAVLQRWQGPWPAVAPAPWWQAEAIHAA